MLICYYLAATLMISDGVEATPVSAYHKWYIYEGLGSKYLAAFNANGNGPRYFKIDENETSVDSVLQNCDKRAKETKE